MNRLMKKIMLGITTMFVFALMFGIGVMADESLTVSVDQYKTDNGKIIVYTNDNHEGELEIDASQSKIVVGKQNLDIENVVKFKDINEGVSYLFVVDISGSMDKNRIDTIKNTIDKFIESKGANDNICVITMGDELISSGFLTDNDELKSFVDAIEVTRQDTDLYRSIVEELNVLKTDKQVKDKRCLVIFSDGADDQEGGITREEAETQVKEAHIPIFTVALLPTNYKDKDLESAKILGSFARYSSGGIHYVPQIDGIECEDVCDKIMDAINNSLVLSADLADVTAADGNVYLGVDIYSGTENAKDGMEIPVGDILDAIKEAQSVTVNVNINNTTETEPAVVETETETQTETVDEEGSNSMIIILIVALAVIIIIIIVVLVVLSKNKNKNKTSYTYVSNEPVISNDGIQPNYKSSSTIGFNQVSSAPEPEKPKVKELEPGAKIVKLVKLGKGEEEKYDLGVDTTKRSIGRKAECDLTIPNDSAISGVHCYLYMKDGKMYIQDNNSTNKTFVNGVPITGEFPIEDGDVILVGSAEYRIIVE